MKPQFTHNCTDCILLAVDELGDWYVCPRSENLGRSVLLRIGNPGEQYISQPLTGLQGPVTEFVQSALLRGLRLTEVEVRAMLAATLWDPPRRVSERAPAEIEDVTEALQAAVKES